MLWLAAAAALWIDARHGGASPLGLPPAGRPAWLACSLGFALAFWGAGAVRLRRRVRRACALLMSGTAFGLLLVFPAGVDQSLLLALVASVLPGVVQPPGLALWLGLQLVVLATLFGRVLTPADAALNTAYSAVVQGVMALLVLFADRERHARAALAASNLQLLLETSSREAERMRIARELYDTLGHHLTVLNLELKLLYQQTGGEARESVLRGREVNKKLLRDLRAAVDILRAGPPDLWAFADELARSAPGLRVHVQLPAHLPCTPRAMEEVLMRFMQVALTNSLRHAGSGSRLSAGRAGWWRAPWTTAAPARR